MKQADYIQIVKDSAKVIVVAIFMALMGILLASQQALGLQLKEVEPGILEMRQAEKGSLVISKVHFSKNKKWIYFAVTENTGLSSRLGASDGVTRYFYAPTRDFKNVHADSKVNALQYGLAKTLNNARGRIPFGEQKIFYRMVDFKPQS